MKGIASYRPKRKWKKPVHCPHSHTVVSVPIPIFEMRTLEAEIRDTQIGVSGHTDGGTPAPPLSLIQYLPP